MTTDAERFGERTPVPVEAMNDLAPFAALFGWVLMFLAVVGVPMFVLVGGLHGCPFSSWRYS